MRERLTIPVESVRERVNLYLATSGNGPDDRDKRLGACIVLEDILHATGNYRGFQYVNRGGAPTPAEDVVANNHDETRRSYR